MEYYVPVLIEHQLQQQDDRLLCSLPSSSILCVVAQQFPTPDRMPPQDRKLPQTTPILPSLPVKDSLLHQLGNADNGLPHGLARLKYNLLLSPSHTQSQESNICTNRGLSNFRESWTINIQVRLHDIIAESPIAPHGPDPDVDYGKKVDWFKGPKGKTFRSVSYLDQIALVCLAAGLHECRAPDCLQYRRKLESVVPVCHSWPALRDWVLCIISCSMRAIRIKHMLIWPTPFMPSSGNEESKFEQLRIKLEDENQSDDPINRFQAAICRPIKFQDSLVSKEDKMSKEGWGICYGGPGIMMRCWEHLTACILLTMPPGYQRSKGWDLTGMSESEILEKTANKSGSIGGPRPDQTIYHFERTEVVSSRRCPRFTITSEFLTCRRNANIALAPHQCLGLTFIRKHLILYKREVPQVHQLMLLRFSS